MEPISHPDAESVRPVSLSDLELLVQPAHDNGRRYPNAERQTCRVCHKPLAGGERDVHKGRCRRVRKSQLQKLRRWRSRR